MNDIIDDYSLAIIGGGSAAEELLRRLDGSDERIVLFEPDLIGGECPFVACMPSKAILHDVSTGRSWTEAVGRRDEVAEHRDDSDHADAARGNGATIVRRRARLVGDGTVEADGTTYRVDRTVIATGSEPDVPEIDGLDADHPRVWNSRDALVTDDRPDSMVILGGGVVGTELAFAFAGFGTDVTVLEQSDRFAVDLHPRVGEIVADVLKGAGVDVVHDVEVERVDLADDGVEVRCGDGTTHSADVLLTAVGRSRNLASIGLESLGLDETSLEVEPSGRIAGTDTVSIAGDAAGLGQYTHLANHHARVLADHIVGSGTRTYDDAVVPACTFIDPAVFRVGPTWTDLDGDDDVVWAEIDVNTARSVTDELRVGFMAVAARRSTGCVIAAHGIGPRFDELVHSLVIAIDGEVPVGTLARCIQPFPTVGEALGMAFRSLSDEMN